MHADINKIEYQLYNSSLCHTANQNTGGKQKGHLWINVEFLGWPNGRSTNCIQESSHVVITFKSVLVKAAPSYKDENTLAFYSNGLALRRELKMLNNFPL